MIAAPTVAIDLPLKALVWQDAAGAVWLAYNEPAWLARRHGLGPEVAAAVASLGTMLRAMADKATAAP